MAAQKRQTSKKSVDAEKLAAKKARREARQAEEAAAKKAAARKKKLRSYALISALIVAAAVVLWALWGAFFPGEVEGVESFSSAGSRRWLKGLDSNRLRSFWRASPATPGSGHQENCGRPSG